MRAAGIAVNFPICQSAHDRRLAWLQGDPKTRYSSRGVIAIDKTLGDHAGKLIADVGWCLAHTALCLELITDAMARGIPGDVTFASYFTSAKVLNHLESSKRAYVRDVKLNRKVVYDGREPSLQAVVRQIPWQAKKPVRMGSRRYWYSRKQMRIPEVKHPVRIVVVWQERDDAEVSKARVSHRLTWEVIRMVLGYRHRWTGTETFHRDGTQELGLGDCQGRTGEGPTHHVYLVSTAFSLLMRSLHQSRPQEWARTLLTTIGEAWRAVKGELLGQLVDWIVEKLADDHWPVPQIKAVLTRT